MKGFIYLIKKMGILRKYIILLILRSPFDAARTWMKAALMKTVFLCLEMKDADKLSEICVIYGLICGLLFLYNGTVWSIYAAFSVKVEAMLHKKMLERLLSLSYKQVDSRLGGEWLTNLNSDIQAASMMMNGALNIPHAVVAIINTVLSSVWMFRGSLLMYALTGLFLFPHLFLHYHIVLKPMPKLKEASLNAMAESTSAIKPLITEAEIIQLYDAGDLMMQKCEESSRRLMKVNMSMHMRNAFSSAVMQLSGKGGYLVMLLLGYRVILAGNMAFSDLTWCFQVRGSILAGVSMLTTSLNHIKANLVCVNRINDTLKG